jgi:hypothetical protein
MRLYAGQWDDGELPDHRLTTPSTPMTSSSVLLRAVVNPPTAGPATVAVSTTSDLTSTTGHPDHHAGQVGVGIDGHAQLDRGGRDQATGRSDSRPPRREPFAPYIGNVTLTLPPGTTFGSFTGGWVTDTTADESTYNCSVVSGTTVSCKTYFPPGSAAGDAFTVVLDGVTNTLTTGPTTVSVATSVGHQGRDGAGHHHGRHLRQGLGQAHGEHSRSRSARPSHRPTSRPRDRVRCSRRAAR